MKWDAAKIFLEEEKVNYLVAKIQDYIDQLTESDPIRIIDFCVKVGISKAQLYRLADKHSQLREAMQKIVNLEEQYLLRGAETGKINPVFSIFRLKQVPFLYKDKHEVESNINVNNMTEEEKQKKLKELMDQYIQLSGNEYQVIRTTPEEDKDTNNKD